MLKVVVISLIFFFALPNVSVSNTTLDFSKLPAFSNPKLSPDGTKIAATVVHDGKPLVITRSLIKAGESANINAIRVGDLHLANYTWANDSRLIVEARSSFKLWSERWNRIRMTAVNHDGSEAKFLPMEKGVYGYMQYPRVVHTLPENNEEILASLDNELNTYFPKVQRVNIYTGKKKTVQRNNRKVSGWMADELGNLRLGMKVSSSGVVNDIRIIHKSAEGKAYKLLSKADYFDSERIQPILFDKENPNVLAYVTDATYDSLSDSDNFLDKLLAVNVVTGEKLGKYKHKLHSEIVASAKITFGEKQKARLVSYSRNRMLATVSIYSDISPPQYFLYDRQKKEFIFLADSYPLLIKDQLSVMKEVLYQSRDGLTIPAYLTIPKNAESKKEPTPLIVMPHGGPWARDYWGFNNYVQFFASKGYAVFQPQFRGSTGFGVAHEEAGYGEWGEAIQDDITDGVNWLINSGRIDRNKICIAGAGFGGYAAAIATVKTPEIYACVVSINGVLDFPKILKRHKKYFLSNQNKKISKDFFGATKVSPIHQAEKIKTPALIIAGRKDTIVDASHSRSFVKRMKKLEKEVDYLEFKEGEHWPTDQVIEEKIFVAMEKFLARHLDQ